MQATPAAPANISHDVIEALTKRTQDGGTEVVNAKAGKVSIRAGLLRIGRSVWEVLPLDTRQQAACDKAMSTVSAVLLRSC
jgi:malate/lactate dehydrogenase